MKRHSRFAQVGLAVGFALALGANAFAASDANAESAGKEDKTGTNPLNFQNTVGLKNEFNGIGGRYANVTRLTYSQPLRPNWKLGVELPLLATDVSGTDEFGLSDIVLKTSWIPYATKTMGVALGTDLVLPTATDDVLGSEKWQLAPSVTVAFFLPHNLIFAPAYKHGVSLAGEERRADIQTGTLDFYLVWKFAQGRQWLTFDPTLLFNYEGGRYDSGTLRLTYGRVLGKVGDAVVSGFLKPGIGMGRSRPNDWSIEAGVSLIGF
jgi:hypothetical protein